ncbi:MAG: zinc ribbon domain-containing protein [Acidobacteriaceae bacterium]
MPSKAEPAFQTAKFKVHNPSRHKRTMLEYAFARYHDTMRDLLPRALDQLNLDSISDPKCLPRKNEVGKLVRRLLPGARQGWPLGPLRDYLDGDATAALMSHIEKRRKGKHASNPPSLASREAMSDEEYLEAYAELTRMERPLLVEKYQEKLDQLREDGKPRVAERMEAVFRNRQSSQAAGAILRRLEGLLPRPIEFSRMEITTSLHSAKLRGAALARNHGRYYLLARLFSDGHRYEEEKVLAEGMEDCVSGRRLGGLRFKGVILPLEMGREFHEQEYLANGTPRSVKLLMRRVEDRGETEFHAHIAFEFHPATIQTTTLLGIDRGAAKLGAATILGSDGSRMIQGINLEGAAFSQEMRELRARIAKAQSEGKRASRFFRLRKRRAELVLGEYANRLVALALEHGCRIVLEKIDKTSMARFLTQSQFGRLQQKLEYKLRRAGLPPMVEVPAARTSQTCAHCGHWARENRTSQDVFLCQGCGHSANADENASEVIALRGLHQLERGGRFQKFKLFQEWLIVLRAGTAGGGSSQ